jgi:glycosyltransferase involved in cell wall biosynthesis
MRRRSACRMAACMLRRSLASLGSELPDCLPELISFVVISKDEPQLAQTLTAIREQADTLSVPSELVVVDASAGCLDTVRREQTDVQWFDFTSPPGVKVSIPHQRNFGVRQSQGDVIVFTDSGCLPERGWAQELTAEILDGSEQVTSGRTVGRGGHDLYDAFSTSPVKYLRESPTINFAFTRNAFDHVGGFDERFEYGSDVDFSWRLTDAGFRIRYIPAAIVIADWGSRRRQLRRAWLYGRARARLYSKHRGRLRSAWRTDPVPFAYALFLLGLPLTSAFPVFPLLLVLPLARGRRSVRVLTVADHLLQGAGFLRELTQL